MKNVSQFSVDDEIAIGFSYTAGHCIAIDFERCWSVEQGNYVVNPCSLIIKQWVKASVIGEGDTDKEQPLERRLGIIDMVLWIESKDSVLQMWVETIDGRYLLLKFENAIAGYVFSDARQ